MQAQHLAATLALYNLVKGQVGVLKVPFDQPECFVPVLTSLPASLLSSRCTSSSLPPTGTSGWSGKTASSNSSRRAALPPTNPGTSSSPGSWPDLNRSSRTRAEGSRLHPEHRAENGKRSLRNPGRTWIVLILEMEVGTLKTRIRKVQGQGEEKQAFMQPESSSWA